MRMSCNGCRVLRKGCTENCTIRPCLQWIKSSDSQANATLFLAKFYGRAGLLNLIEAGPENLRPAIFRSLLYEACGRVVNPVYGSIGMLWSGNWGECQAAVDAVLKGSPITQTSSSLESVEEEQPISPLKTYDIRHVFKDTKPAAAADIDKVKTRTRFKRSRTRSKRQVVDSWMSQLGNGDSKEDESTFSVETVEGSLVNHAKRGPILKFEDSSNVGLELTLALLPEATHLG
ncbi:hypothetical protein ERO13_D02G169800v2 [Gossypium hirsutum]|uniref:LOB domain-containing protein n=8 Tax=Gossypium TaxID=3633 RepID=A0A2P5XAC9_GOSBA|nr:LOB domain-containing protein 42 [Gossypium hirsutum]KAB2042144.1 hypothetical protein ES319_D02G195300v1 [Gossypium barbadense]MBA0613799.1 hypothetical protein [Gossypium davidsonii]MBA0648977.1 hypothetical protein [Gossypium klotzschianum]MBA0766028.1 hypothetical protein [Gossypium trilobum]MBA0798815.1 hypothetical protein [Gossypium harknessii]TYH84698.1 hypothetical protein ES332_D02G213900v1 [Gossypium tomentosum]TYI94392.1 hypothetical protein E1A91_D02G200400v1 [Gossypium muste